MLTQAFRNSKRSATLLLSLAPVFAACGTSHTDINQSPRSAGKGGASGASSGGTSGSHATAGQGSGNAGATSGVRGGSAGNGGANGGGTGGVDGAGRSGASGTSGGGTSGGATGGVGASAGNGGTANGGTDTGGANDGGVAGCVLPGAPQLCSVTPERYGATVIDFQRFSPAGKWSSATADGITGRTSYYHSPSAPDALLEEESGTLHVTVTLPAHSYAGWVFEFDRCSDAGENLGFKFILTGALNGASLAALLQINSDYPIDVANGKGACAFTSCDTIETECKFPSLDIEPSATGADLWLMFTQFMGGVPVNTPSISDVYSVRGLQFELTCESDTPCVVDLDFGTIVYFTA